MTTRWRDCKGWIDSNLPMTSSSDEACKFFDAAIIQMTSLYENSELGGIGNTLKQMMEADPDFVLGQVLVNTLKYSGSQSDRDAVTKALDGISNLALKQKVTDRERKHVTALKLVTEGQTLQVVETYRDILTDSPTDLMACLFAFFTYYELGMSKEMLDMMKFVVEAYSSETPGYSTILAWKAFAHEENSQLVEAEQESYKSSNLACHIAWHEALFLLEKGQFDDAVKIFDEKIITRAATGGNFNDASSLLYRLSFEDVRVPQRWKSVLGLVDKFYEQHRWIYIDAHILFTLYRNGEKERASEMLEKLKSFVKDTTGTNALVTRDVGIPLCAGITAFEEGHYETATNCLNSIRTTLHTIGGSIAQRDTFVQLLIHSAIKSPNPDHKTLARTILNERKTKRADDPLGDRLMSLLENNASD
ncbi:tetratricopeptide repeat protein 38-like isoform X2 [Ostrea edulis]|uniref:tetratricopeptide repeat protein 38-like isoform X2 n=1 Tax=Ostrea edulis TaxID=37623 RepID=UPI0024AFEDD8|nr:tetratricopeptide repeat protein 38-like isoform X2 [Ostrea edulis]